ncbi:MAG: hypothetical protein ACR65O_01720 [Methylomicrobium sp.]
MKKLIDFFTKIRQMSSRRIKIYASSFLIGSFILLPDLYLAGGHYLLEFLHIFYEGLCFMLEELIGHSLHLSKYDSQLILFYTQVAIVAGVAYKTWRIAPRLYRSAIASLRASWQQLIKDGKQLWAEMPGRKRIKILAGCAASMFGLYFWVTS